MQEISQVTYVIARAGVNNAVDTYRDGKDNVKLRIISRLRRCLFFGSEVFKDGVTIRVVRPSLRLSVLPDCLEDG